MKGNVKRLGLAGICLIALISACVTINIYFPAEKVESVAGEIVRDIRGPGSEEKQEPTQERKDSLWRAVRLAWGPAVCHAEEVTDVSNPTIRALKERMKARFDRMKPYYEKGVVREGGDGYVHPGDMGGLGLKEKRDVRGLIDAENNDRKSLYKEVAKALNIDPNLTGRIAETFAKEWRKSLR